MCTKKKNILYDYNVKTKKYSYILNKTIQLLMTTKNFIRVTYQIAFRCLRTFIGYVAYNAKYVKEATFLIL